MTHTIKTIPGTRDILPAESWKWQQIEREIRRLLHLRNFSEIRTPVFESTDLFSRSVGEDTDIVSKEMYTFRDKSKRSLTLKPELTAPVVRAYIQHHLEQVNPLIKVYYIDALFRQERPQAGRLRQFHQFGMEIIGSPYAESDVEVIASTYHIYQHFGLNDISLEINSIGNRESRKKFTVTLKTALKPYLSEFCEDCRKRYSRNTLRLFDCKKESCQAILDNHAPSILDFLEPDDLNHFREVQQKLTGLEISFTINPKMVRGLDYYSRTTFEITSPLLGAQDALCGGGRYDYLVDELGGKPTPAVGVAAGMERLFLALENDNYFRDTAPGPDLFIIPMGQDAMGYGEQLHARLSRNGISSDMDLLRRSVKAQMREANRQNVRFALIIGSTEIEQETVGVKDLSTGGQESVALTELIPYLKDRLLQK